MNQEEREKKVRSKRPEAQSIEWVSSGDVNDVAVVDGTETFRFPRKDEGRQQLIYEFEILKLLHGLLTLAVPEPVWIGTDGFSIVGYIPGCSLTEATIRQLPLSTQQAIGRSLGQFIVDLNSNVNVSDVERLQHLRPDIENWDDWYNSMAMMTTSKYAAIFSDYLARFQKAYPRGLSNGTTIIHDDLHAGNLIFNDNNELVGVIDFGDVGLADIHRELRTIYRMGPEVFDAVVSVLQPKFGAIHMENVRLCAVVHELAVLIEHEAAGTLDSRRAKFANSLLDMWLDEGWNT